MSIRIHAVIIEDEPLARDSSNLRFLCWQQRALSRRWNAVPEGGIRNILQSDRTGPRSVLLAEEGKARRLTLEFGHLGRILARSPRFFRNVFSINTGLPDLASGPFLRRRGTA